MHKYGISQYTDRLIQSFADGKDVSITPDLNKYMLSDGIILIKPELLAPKVRDKDELLGTLDEKLVQNKIIITGVKLMTSYDFVKRGYLEGVYYKAFRNSKMTTLMHVITGMSRKIQSITNKKHRVIGADAFIKKYGYKEELYRAWENSSNIVKVEDDVYCTEIKYNNTLFHVVNGHCPKMKDIYNKHGSRILILPFSTNHCVSTTKRNFQGAIENNQSSDSFRGYIELNSTKHNIHYSASCNGIHFPSTRQDGRREFMSLLGYPSQ